MQMFRTSILEFTMQSLVLILQLSMPPIIVASVAGLLISFFQAVTQLQEQTLAFAVKLLAVSLALMFTAGWLGGEIFNFTVKIFDSFPTLVK